MTDEETYWLDRLEGYAIVMADSNRDSAGWVAAWDMVGSFIRQERARIAHPTRLMAANIGQEGNAYVIKPYDVIVHAEG